MSSRFSPWYSSKTSSMLIPMSTQPQDELQRQPAPVNHRLAGHYFGINRYSLQQFPFVVVHILGTIPIN